MNALNVYLVGFAIAIACMSKIMAHSQRQYQRQYPPSSLIIAMLIGAALSWTLVGFFVAVEVIGFCSDKYLLFRVKRLKRRHPDFKIEFNGKEIL